MNESLEQKLTAEWIHIPLNSFSVVHEQPQRDDDDSGCRYFPCYYINHILENGDFKYAMSFAKGNCLSTAATADTGKAEDNKSVELPNLKVITNKD